MSTEHPHDFSPEPASRRAWGPCCGCLIGLALLLALAAGGAKLHSQVSRSRVQATLAALDADGLGLTGLVPATPAEPNAATLLEPALESMRTFAEHPLAHCSGNNLAFLRELSDPASEGDRLYDPPLLGETEEGPRTLEEAVALIVRRVDGLDAHVDAALAAPVCVFPLDWEAGLLMDLPHLMPLKFLVRVYGTRAVSRQVNGNPRGAWEDVVRMVRLTELHDEPLLITRLVRVASIQVLVHTIEALLHAGPPPTGELLAQLSDGLRRLESRSGFTRALRGELHMEASLLADRGGSLSSVTGEDSLLADRVPVIGEALLASWHADLIELCGEQIRASTLPPFQAQAEMEAIERRIGEGASPLVAMMTPALGKAHEKDRLGVAWLRLARVALRLSESQPVPEALGAEAETDPLDPGQATVRWRRTGARAGVLWSVGPDAVDDGGRLPTSNAPGPNPDVVLRVALPE